MRLLLDECVPRVLGRELKGHAVRTAQQMGWGGIRNGLLLKLANGNFDAFITTDRGYAHQQNLAGLSIAVLLLSARSNRLQDLQPLVPGLLATLPAIRPGTLNELS